MPLGRNSSLEIKQIEEMSSDFTKMLKQTLVKMQEWIELANFLWDGDESLNSVFIEKPVSNKIVERK